MSQVTCIGCNASIDLAKADVTGRGYRCVACSLKASLAADAGHNDVADHLTGDERAARAKNAGLEIVIGAGAAVVGAGVTIGMSGLLGIIMLCSGLGMVSHGLLTRREMTGERTH